VNAGHAGPGEGIAIKQLRKKLGHIAKLVSLKPMYSTILFLKDGIKHFHPDLVQLTESLTKKAIKPQVGALLAADFNQHVGHLTLRVEEGRGIMCTQDTVSAVGYCNESFLLLFPSFPPRKCSTQLR